MTFITATRIVVKAQRLMCYVSVCDACPRSSSPALMSVLLRERPLLAQHSCVNGVGPTFSAVMNDTAIIHVLEHLAIDIQTQEANDATRAFVGTSEWLDKQAGTGLVELSFSDDVQALCAVKKALLLLNEALTTIS